MIDPYSMHIGSLRKAVDILRGISKSDIFAVEYGAGQFSTPLLSEICDRVVTVELNIQWASSVRYLESSRHEVTSNMNKCYYDADLVFLDNEQEHRIPLANRYRDTPLVVMHDVEEKCYQEVFGLFEYSRVDKHSWKVGERVYNNWTGIFSNTIELEEDA